LVTTPRRLILEAVHCLQHVPPVVFSSGARCGLKVDLFPRILTYIGDKKVTCDPVESAAPWVAHTVCPDLVQCVRVAHEWVIRWNGVVAIRVSGKIIAVNVYTQNLPQPGLEILSVLLRITAAAPIAESDVQVPVRTKGELSSVVVGERLILSQDYLRGVWISDVWIFGRHRVTRYLGVAQVVGVIDVEESVTDVVRVESEAQ
jgi:hypothetical protein